MARTSSFELYDRILDGKLRGLIAGWRAEGASLEEIAFRLREMKVTASAGTVGRWIKEHDIAATEPAA